MTVYKLMMKTLGETSFVYSSKVFVSRYQPLYTFWKLIGVDARL